MVDRPAELLALCRKTGERELEAPVALGREAEKRHPAVASRLLACDEPALLGAAHELRDGGLPTPVGRALDHQQQQVALRSQTGLPRDALALAQEGAQGRAEIRDRDVVVQRHRLDPTSPVW